jgi:hypothetical protein
LKDTGNIGGTNDKNRNAHDDASQLKNVTT